MPQLAIAQAGSFASTSRNVVSAAEYQNECSIATPRFSSTCTAGMQEFAKLTLPSFPFTASSSCACAKLQINASDAAACVRMPGVFIAIPLLGAWVSARSRHG